ncbi:MAG TPA: phosphoglucosamine mutase [Methanomicrobiales archaeon]|nr:phosphoglucosamine mutase [Methanomicrobiales archaeon]
MGSKKITKRLFGTNGVRGVVGAEMTPELVLHIGAALGSMCRGSIGVGRDTRTSGMALSNALKAGIMSTGCDVVDLGILPTPALQYLVKKHDYGGGAMITASHNPPEYNGVKVIAADGTEMGDETILLLEERVFARDFASAPWADVGRETEAPHLLQEYVEGVVSQFPPGIGKGMTVVVDPGSGPSCRTTPEILTLLGCRVLTVNAQMDGRFPGRLPEPSAEGLSALSTMVRESGAAFGVAHDGDADRAVFVDDRGRFVEENAEFALLEQFVCRSQKGVVVAPVSSSRRIRDVAEAQGCRVEYTPVGSVYVARRMREMAERGEKVVFGGEGNGGLIFPSFQFCRDGAMTAATMVHLLAGEDRPLSSLLLDLPPLFMIQGKVKTRRAAEILSAIEKAYARESLDFTDGIRIEWDDVWALVRASGTEPLVRIVVESKDMGKAERIYQEILHHIEGAAA